LLLREHVLQLQLTDLLLGGVLLMQRHMQLAVLLVCWLELI